MSSEKVELKLDWCSHEAALFACKNWHYSKSIPKSKTVKIGVWENSKYIGCIIYSYGATPHIGSPYGLKQQQICELTRIALSDHKNSVSKMISISIKMLKKLSPNLRLIVSYADKDQDHAGGIYQASNWVYSGLMNENSRGAFIINGQKVHPRTIGSKGGVQSIQWVKQNIDKNAKEFYTTGKHKYLMPLDDAMRKQVELLRKPYPKRAGSSKIEQLAHQQDEGGVVPTPALHLSEKQESSRNA